MRGAGGFTEYNTFLNLKCACSIEIKVYTPLLCKCICFHNPMQWICGSKNMFALMAALQIVCIEYLISVLMKEIEKCYLHYFSLHYLWSIKGNVLLCVFYYGKLLKCWQNWLFSSIKYLASLSTAFFIELLVTFMLPCCTI